MVGVKDDAAPYTTTRLTSRKSKLLVAGVAPNAVLAVRVVDRSGGVGPGTMIDGLNNCRSMNEVGWVTTVRLGLPVTTIRCGTLPATCTRGGGFVEPLFPTSQARTPRCVTNSRSRLLLETLPKARTAGVRVVARNCSGIALSSSRMFGPAARGRVVLDSAAHSE